MRVYLAGKIEKAGWREEILGGGGRCASFNPDELQQCLRSTGRFPIEEYPGFDYCGPYFVSDDHGCFHGPQGHGAVGPNGDGDGGDQPNPRHIPGACLAGVAAADIVFAHIESGDCHGTLIEIGYAIALGKDLWLSFPGCDGATFESRYEDKDIVTNLAQELWFLRGLVPDDHVIYGEKAGDAFLLALVRRARKP